MDLTVSQYHNPDNNDLPSKLLLEKSLERDYSLRELLISKPPQSFVQHVKQYSERIHLLCSDCRNMPFADNQFDSAWAFGLWGWWMEEEGEFEKFLNEMARVLKNGGKGQVTCVPFKDRGNYPDGFSFKIN